MRDNLPNLEQNIRVALYSGPGAELVKDVELIIQTKILYQLINASQLRRGVLNDFQLLILPGGITAHYVPGFKAEGCGAIRNFLKQGGRYLGICAGAYIASTPELAISKSKMVRKTGIYTCEITIQDLTHPIFKGINKSNLMVYYQNGPHIQPDQQETSLALYKDGTASVIETSNALIFSWHPEKLQHTIPILFNSIEYLTK